MIRISPAQASASKEYKYFANEGIAEPFFRRRFLVCRLDWNWDLNFKGIAKPPIQKVDKNLRKPAKPPDT
jgi:hypothetical protein